MTGMPALHPMIVHFPLALIVSAACLLGAARLPWADRHASVLSVVGTWNLCLGSVCLLAALATGLYASIGLNVGAAAHAALAAHVKSAVLTALLVLPAALWRGVGVAASSRPSAWFLALLWAATAALLMTGYRGGRNVYDYGIGVEIPAAGAMP